MSPMRLPVMPPVKPMLAKACDLDDTELLKWIEQESVGFEPKWEPSLPFGAGSAARSSPPI